MERSLQNLSGSTFDIVVVGGGIYGACVARDAALRGLSVALFERDDFGSRTSHNSLKLLHGGMRYIQHLDFVRMRQSVLERRAWLRIAPHLARPLKFVMQTKGHLTRGKEALWTATRIHETVGMDRNKGLDDAQRIPPGAIYNRADADALIPGMAGGKHNGAASWYDGQLLDADRVLMECLQSAVEHGAVIANYAEVTGLRVRSSRVDAVEVADTLSGEHFEVRAHVTINTCGPWVDQLRLNGNSHSDTVIKPQPKTLNMNLVTRELFADYAIGVKSTRQSDSVVDRGGRLFFVTPWRGVSVIGTTHDHYDGETDACEVGSDTVLDFLDEFNAAYPPAKLTPADVHYCYWGLTPGTEGMPRGEAGRARHGQIIAHRRADGLQGLVSIIGVKWTTARLVAEKALDIALKEMQMTVPVCRSATEPLPGARGFTTHNAVERELSEQFGAQIGGEDKKDVAVEYGARWRQLLPSLPDQQSAGEDAWFRCKARHAVDSEMAQRLSDVLCRRTSLLQRGLLRQRHVDWCLAMMADHNSWSGERQEFELADFERQCRRAHASVLP